MPWLIGPWTNCYGGVVLLVFVFSFMVNVESFVCQDSLCRSIGRYATVICCFLLAIWADMYGGPLGPEVLNGLL